MKMVEVIDAYVTLQKSRGMRFDTANKIYPDSAGTRKSPLRISSAAIPVLA